MSSITKDHVRFGPTPLPLSPELEKAIADFKADLLKNERTFVEIRTETHWSLTIPVNQPVIAAPAAVEG